MTRDLFTSTLAGSRCFGVGWFSAVSLRTLLLMTDPLSVDIDLLRTGGDGDLLFPELTIFSSARIDIFGIDSFSICIEGNLDLLCLPDEQVLA